MTGVYSAASSTPTTAAFTPRRTAWIVRSGTQHSLRAERDEREEERRQEDRDERDAERRPSRSARIIAAPRNADEREERTGHGLRRGVAREERVVPEIQPGRNDRGLKQWAGQRGHRRTRARRRGRTRRTARCSGWRDRMEQRKSDEEDEIQDRARESTRTAAAARAHADATRRRGPAGTATRLRRRSRRPR